MPKKPPRHSAHHRPQPKRKDVLLVRASSTEVADVEEEEEQETTNTGKAGAAKTKPTGAAVKTAARPASTAKSGAQPARALPASKRAGRPGQRPGARPGPRIAVGRQANLVSAEHYRYVLKDLRLIGVLAFCAFSILVALTFILPHVLSY